jgi:flagellar biogenesis protein FliO
MSDFLKNIRFWIISSAGIFLFLLGSVIYGQSLQPSKVSDLDESSLVITDDLDVAPKGVAKPVSSNYGFKAFFGLVIILAMAYGILVFFRRLSGQNPQSSSIIKVIATQTLYNQTTLHIVEIAGEYYILGCGRDIQLIDKVTSKQVIDEILFNISQKPVVNTFATLLKNKFVKNGIKVSSISAQPKTSILTQKHFERLQKLQTDFKPSEEDKLE